MLWPSGGCHSLLTPNTVATLKFRSDLDMLAHRLCQQTTSSYMLPPPLPSPQLPLFSVARTQGTGGCFVSPPAHPPAYLLTPHVATHIDRQTDWLLVADFVLPTATPIAYFMVPVLDRYVSVRCCLWFILIRWRHHIHLVQSAP